MISARTSMLVLWNQGGTHALAIYGVSCSRDSFGNQRYSRYTRADIDDLSRAINLSGREISRRLAKIARARARRKEEAKKRRQKKKKRKKHFHQRDLYSMIGEFKVPSAPEVRKKELVVINLVKIYPVRSLSCVPRARHSLDVLMKRCYHINYI